MTSVSGNCHCITILQIIAFSLFCNPLNFFGGLFNLGNQFRQKDSSRWKTRTLQKESKCGKTISTKKVNDSKSETAGNHHNFNYRSAILSLSLGNGPACVELWLLSGLISVDHHCSIRLLRHVPKGWLLKRDQFKHLLNSFAVWALSVWICKYCSGFLCKVLTCPNSLQWQR